VLEWDMRGPHLGGRLSSQDLYLRNEKSFGSIGG
jgi:hypothetical protein